MEERVIVVDREDNIIGDLPRSQITPETYYRISSLFVYNDNGEVLLGKRSASKLKNPNGWLPIVNGTNAKGETYESNIIKETKEEIGYQLNNFWTVATVRVEENFNFYVRYFGTVINDESTLLLDQNEISEMKWFNKEQLSKDLNTKPENFTKKFQEIIFPLIWKNKD